MNTAYNSFWNENGQKMAIFCKKELNCTLIYNSTKITFMSIKVSKLNKQYMVHSAYIPPLFSKSTPTIATDLFLEHFQEIEKIFTDNFITEIVNFLIGDLNFKLNYLDKKIQTAHGSLGYKKIALHHMNQFTNKFKLLQHNDIPNSYGNFLDICFSNSNNVKISKAIKICPQSSNKLHNSYSIITWQ